MRRRLRIGAGSTNERILRAAVTVGFLTAVVNVASIGKDLIVAREFGLGADMDAFLLAFMLPTLALNILGVSFGSAFVPTYIQVRDVSGSEEAGLLMSSILAWSIVLLAAVSVVLAMVVPPLLPHLGGAFASGQLIVAKRLFYILLPAVFVGGVANVWTALLNAGERFALGAVAPAAVPLGTIVVLELLRGSVGIYALAVGTLLGTICQGLLLAHAVRRTGASVRPRFSGISPELRRVTSQYWPVVAGSLLMSGSLFIDQAMAAHLPTGSLAALNYGSKVVSIVVGLSGTAIATAMLPHFSQLVAANNFAGVRHTLKTYTLLLVAISVPATGVLIAASHLIVHVLFRGHAFTDSDVNLVARVQSFFALQIPFYVSGLVGVRMLSALGRNRTLVWITLVNLLVNTSGNLLLMRTMGAPGIALSTSIVYALSCAMIFAAALQNLRSAERQVASSRGRESLGLPPLSTT